MKTYSLTEVAELVLPPEWTDGARWLARRLNRGEINGYRVGRIWRMTEDQVRELVAAYTNTTITPAPVGEPVAVIDGLSARARIRRTA